MREQTSCIGSPFSIVSSSFQYVSGPRCAAGPLSVGASDVDMRGTLVFQSSLDVTSCQRMQPNYQNVEHLISQLNRIRRVYGGVSTELLFIRISFGELEEAKNNPVMSKRI